VFAVILPFNFPVMVRPVGCTPSPAQRGDTEALRAGACHPQRLFELVDEAGFAGRAEL
jgi:hypothetical protein